MSKLADNKFAGLRSRQPTPPPPVSPAIGPEAAQEGAQGEGAVGEGGVAPPAPPAPPAAPASVSAPSGKKGARAGKVTVAGYFSEDLSREFKMLALQSGVTVQALLGEAIDDLFRKHGKHPFGER